MEDEKESDIIAVVPTNKKHSSKKFSLIILIVLLPILGFVVGAYYMSLNSSATTKEFDTVDAPVNDVVMQDIDQIIYENEVEPPRSPDGNPESVSQFTGWKVFKDGAKGITFKYPYSEFEYQFEKYDGPFITKKGEEDRDGHISQSYSVHMFSGADSYFNMGLRDNLETYTPLVYWRKKYVPDDAICPIETFCYRVVFEEGFGDDGEFLEKYTLGNYLKIFKEDSEDYTQVYLVDNESMSNAIGHPLFLIPISDEQMMVVTTSYPATSYLARMMIGSLTFPE